MMRLFALNLIKKRKGIMASKITQFFYNVKFWIKTNFFVKPAVWLDSKTNPNFGNAMYHFARITTKVILFVFPILFIVLASITATSGGGLGEWSFQNDLTNLSVWLMIGLSIMLASTIFATWWFKKFAVMTTEKVVSPTTIEKDIVIREDAEKKYLARKEEDIHRKVAPAIAEEYKPKSSRRVKTSTKPVRRTIKKSSTKKSKTKKTKKGGRK